MKGNGYEGVGALEKRARQAHEPTGGVGGDFGRISIFHARDERARRLGIVGHECAGFVVIGREESGLRAWHIGRPRARERNARDGAKRMVYEMHLPPARRAEAARLKNALLAGETARRQKEIAQQASALKEERQKTLSSFLVLQCHAPSFYANLVKRERWGRQKDVP